MKESKAKTKLCPHMRSFQSVASVSKEENTYCKGSDCMMWDSHEWEQNNPDPKGVPSKIIMNEGKGDCDLKPKELYCEGCN